MAALWPLSRIPLIDPNGDPYGGAQAFFYNVGTSTPQNTYSDSSLSTVSAHNGDGAVVANANGAFPAIFLSATPGTYRQRVLDADDVVIFDDDGISVYQAADYVPPDTGSTSATLLFVVGMVIARHGTGTLSGFVRCGGRTIGSATSGASERANADTSALFQFLWDADSTLSVSSGRGATAAGDFAANKTIALPDYRERALVGLADMGNTAGTLLSGNTVDNSETTITLGATLGVGTHTLTTAQMPSHIHTGTTSTDGNHAHTYAIGSSDANGGIAADGNAGSGNPSTSTNGLHNHTFTSDPAGSSAAHPNAQPSALVTYYIHL